MGQKKDYTDEVGGERKRKSPKICGTNYPVSIAFIVVNEFCERFSYYGMKAVLTLYFIHYLKWDKDLSTAIYHAFSSLCYFTPILGAIIADSWLGKFKTIIYLSIVYVIGHVIKSVGAIPDVGDSTVHIALSMVGLILIAFGTGGIKPCVAAFGGDQFEEEHTEERRKFFSIFYMSINAGSVLSTVVTPILRGDVQCFGADCYALAFGVPAVLMIIALVVFIAGSGLYKRTPPEGNVLLQVCRCIGFAIGNRWRSSNHQPKREHWLDWAREKYPKRLIAEIKMVLRVLVLYIPLPMFWALFDQQGSRWTLQATRMNLDFGAFVLKPDQMQMLNALLILVFIPIFDMGVYPLIGLCKIKLTPLKKMAAGMVLAALAFVAATIVERSVIETVVKTPPARQSLIQVLNLAQGDVIVSVQGNTDLFPQPIRQDEDPEYKSLQLDAFKQDLTFTLKLTESSTSTSCVKSFTEETAYTLILSSNAGGIQCTLAKDNIIKSENGEAHLRFINTISENFTITVGEKSFNVPPGDGGEIGVSNGAFVDREMYSDVKCESNSAVSHLDIGLVDFGASYTFVLFENSGQIKTKTVVDVHANNVHIGWQVPQYALLTAGEVMFSITGLEFSYSQAPNSMKSVLQAGWLMTVAFGNVIVLIVAEGAGMEQWIEFLLFACLLIGVCLIFSIMAYFYTYVDPDNLNEQFGDDTEMDAEDDPKKKNKDDIHMYEQINDTNGQQTKM